MTGMSWYSRIAILLGLILPAAVATARGQDGTPRQTVVTIDGSRWLINGQATYPGSAAEGLLMNVRMVNATFEDRNRDDFDPEANTAEFLAAMPRYVQAGVRAFTLCLQGGMPGYEAALNSAYERDGTLRESYLARVARVIDACDRQGVVVILGCYYQRQDQVLRDRDAVRRGVVNTVRWIKSQGYTNVLLEIANEFGHSGFDHDLHRRPEGQVELIELARREHPLLLVSTSGGGSGRFPATVAEASDFLLIHFNNTPLGEIPGRIEALQGFGKPIVCNEDDRSLAEFPAAAQAAVAGGASYGLMLVDLNQKFPFTFGGTADAPVVYATYRQLTTPRSGAAGD